MEHVVAGAEVPLQMGFHRVPVLLLVHLRVIMKPTPERNYYVLSTFGMGAHRMNVPEELADQKLERAEIIATLPPDWKLGQEGSSSSWALWYILNCISSKVRGIMW